MTTFDGDRVFVSLCLSVLLRLSGGATETLCQSIFDYATTDSDFKDDTQDGEI